MVVLTAYKSVDMSPTSTSYIPPSGLGSIGGTPTSSEIDTLDPTGRLQRYFGSFNLLDLQQLKFDTSTFTGYKQYEGGNPSTTLEYEFSGASINGAVAFAFIQNKDPYGLVQEIFKGDDLFTGSDQADILASFKGADNVKGFAGADFLSGGEGNDFLNGNQGLDTVDGGKGDDTVHGGKGADLLSGGAGNDQLFGDLGNDQLFGNEGNDRITGNAGNDTSTGGLGADRFVLSKDFDVILDFSAGQGDKIEVLASTPYTLGSSINGDLQIIRAEGTTTLLGVSPNSFDPNTSIVLI